MSPESSQDVETAQPLMEAALLMAPLQEAIGGASHHSEGERQSMTRGSSVTVTP